MDYLWRNEAGDWCNTSFVCPTPYGTERKFSCRRARGHAGGHGCPAHDSHCQQPSTCEGALEPLDMEYIYKTLGINIPEEGITT